MTMKTKVVDGYNSKNGSVMTIGWKSQKNYLESKVVGGDNSKDGLCGKDKNDILEAPTEVLFFWVPSLRRNHHWVHVEVCVEYLPTLRSTKTGDVEVGGRVLLSEVQQLHPLHLPFQPRLSTILL